MGRGGGEGPWVLQEGGGGGRGDYVIGSQGAKNFAHCDLSNAVPTTE